MIPKEKAIELTEKNGYLSLEMERSKRRIIKIVK